MHRRSRHLNARHAGAELVLDARRISGLNHNDSISTWRDVSGKGRDATQGTGTKQPTYKTNQLNGQPICDFDGGDGLATASYSFPVVQTSTVLFKTSTNCIVYERGASLSAVGATYLYTTTSSATGVNSSGGISAKNLSANWGSDSTWKLATESYNGTHETNTLSISGISQSLTTFSGFNNDGTGSGSFATNVGARTNASSLFLTGGIAFLMMATFVNPSLKKRIEHSVAFSFKIRCS